MPALDSCEPPVIRAFQKDGWQIAKKPQSILLMERTLFADLRLERRSNGSIENVIIVEVKCFSNPENDVAEFYTAVGQYQLYRSALSFTEPSTPVYLALPSIAFERLSREPSMLHVLGTSGIKWVVVDIEIEEIVAWTR